MHREKMTTHLGAGRHNLPLKRHHKRLALPITPAADRASSRESLSSGYAIWLLMKMLPGQAQPPHISRIAPTLIMYLARVYIGTEILHRRTSEFKPQSLSKDLSAVPCTNRRFSNTYCRFNVCMFSFSGETIYTRIQAGVKPAAT
jgi:hypothetical protein